MSSEGDELVVCLPPSGAGRSFYRLWPRQIANATVVPLSRPGDEERAREPQVDSVAAAASDVATWICNRSPKNTVLFGHSLGAIAAFEAVRILEHNQIPVQLIVSARQAPNLDRCTAHLADADDRTILSRLTDWGGELGSDPDDPLAAHILPGLRVDFTMSANYRWSGHTTAVPITSISYHDDPVVAEADIRAWKKVTSGTHTHISEPGDHYSAAKPSATILHLIEKLHAPTPSES